MMFWWTVPLRTRSSFWRERHTYIMRGNGWLIKKIQVSYPFARRRVPQCSFLLFHLRFSRFGSDFAGHFSVRKSRCSSKEEVNRKHYTVISNANWSWAARSVRKVRYYKFRGGEFDDQRALFIIYKEELAFPKMSSVRLSVRPSARIRSEVKLNESRKDAGIGSWQKYGYKSKINGESENAHSKFQRMQRITGNAPIEVEATSCTVLYCAVLYCTALYPTRSAPLGYWKGIFPEKLLSLIH